MGNEELLKDYWNWVRMWKNQAANYKHRWSFTTDWSGWRI